MSKPKILVFAVADKTGATHRQMEAAGYEVILGKPHWLIPGNDCEDEIRGIARDVVALTGTSLRSNPITRRIMEASQRLRIVSKCTVGVDDIDVDEATELGIMVTHAPTESNCYGVVETTMALLLGALKEVRERDQWVRDGKWRDDLPLNTYLGKRKSDLYPGITFGILGLGRIGSRVAELLAPWRLGRVIGYDPYVEDEKFILHGVERVKTFDELLAASDVVSIHVTLTKETRHMFNDRAFGLMKPSALLINTARGKVVDEAALDRALAAGKLRRAAIDAWEDEPLAAASPLRRQPAERILMSPHAASFTVGGGLGQGIEWATRSVLIALEGEVPDTVYNKDVIPRWQSRFGGAKVLAGG